MAFLKYFSDFDLNSKTPIFFRRIVQNSIYCQKTSRNTFICSSLRSHTCKIQLFRRFSNTKIENFSNKRRNRFYHCCSRISESCESLGLLGELGQVQLSTFCVPLQPLLSCDCAFGIRLALQPLRLHVVLHQTRQTSRLLASFRQP